MQVNSLDWFSPFLLQVQKLGLYVHKAVRQKDSVVQGDCTIMLLLSRAGGRTCILNVTRVARRTQYRTRSKFPLLNELLTSRLERANLDRRPPREMAYFIHLKQLLFSCEVTYDVSQIASYESEFQDLV